MIDAAHEQLRTFRNTGRATHDAAVPHQLLLIKTVLTNDQDGLASSLPHPAAEAMEISVDPGGSIWGTGKYQQLDPGWVEAGALWLETILLGKHPFPPGRPNVIPISDRVSIAMAGDWGTGDWGTTANPAASTKIGKLIAAQNADYTIHLGDVYYAGTSGQETNNLLKLWPKGSSGSFTLNSNHEMYSGAKPYFTEVVGSSLFQHQAPYSFFALENANWVIVGLDSAYYGNEDALYADGALDAAAQIPFLQAQAQKGKKVIILTHHNGLLQTGSHSRGQARRKLSSGTTLCKRFKDRHRPAIGIGDTFTPVWLITPLTVFSAAAPAMALCHGRRLQICRTIRMWPGLRTAAQTIPMTHCGSAMASWFLRSTGRTFPRPSTMNSAGSPGLRKAAMLAVANCQLTRADRILAERTAP